MLAYDVEDQGHPVSVGRIVNNILTNKYYFEYKSSEEKNWIGENFAKFIFQMFKENDKNYEEKSNFLIKNKLNLELQGGILSWSDSYGREWAWEDWTKKVVNIQS